MDARRWSQIEQLFDRSLSLPPAEREAFVRKACGSNTELCAVVLGLLEQDATDDDSLEPPDWGLSSGGESFPTLGGPYEIESVLGRGGMGTVYLARRADEQFERLVAVKVLRRGMDTDDVLARFHRERQMLADLQHPGIAQLFDGGTTDDGRPFLVMELVEGSSIEGYCTDNELDTKARVRLFLEVCEAVQFAHESGVVHRDVKPSNVLVTRAGHPKLVDFGIAKLVDVTGQAHTSDVTVTEHRLMTPAYASPEQIRGGRVTVATDVYALGVLLYELLSGCRAFRFETGSPQEIERIVCEEYPTRPSLAALRGGTGPRERLSADLDTICMMALRKEPERRYASARALADDLTRWLEGRPVQARPDTWSYRARRFVRRNGLLVGATAAVVLALLIGLVAEEVRRAQAEAERDKVLRLSAFQQLEDLQREADELWPPRAERLTEFEDWLRRADELIAGVGPRRGDPGHRARLEELRERASSGGNGEPWVFETEQDRWWHGQLVRLLSEIEEFGSPETGPMHGVSVRWGWGVARRRDWAEQSRRRTIEGDEARERWARALRSIADPAECPAYDGLQIEPQVDLLPLGRDATSGLWEFLHVPTGAPPATDGSVGEDTGVVFVLIPAGDFLMGSQHEDQAGPNYVIDAPLEERPAHHVEVSPFFLSKYELTQAQWLRLTGSNPSFYSDAYRNRSLGLTPWHPLESVSWFEAERALSQWGLTLPSEAQWEYAARAGTTTPWWTGPERETIRERGAANLADLAAMRADFDWAAARDWPEFDDGFASTAPVDALAPNPFGLFGVIGNVSEWCRDRFAPEFYARGPAKDPLCCSEETEDSGYRVSRGGSFYDSARQSRSAARNNENPRFRDFNIGVRPARTVE